MRVIDYRVMSDADILELPREVGDRSNDQMNRQVDHWVTINHVHIPITTAQGRSSGEGKDEGSKQYSGDATYYLLPGAKTASGERFDANNLAAAMTSEKARLGQKVTVTYTYQDEQGRTVTRTISVVVNDRGPFARNADGKAMHPLRPDPETVIDLTPSAFRQLVGTLRAGRVHVTVTVPNE